MDLQSWFYALGIVYLVVWIVLMLACLTAVVYIVIFFKNAPKKVEEIVENVIEERKKSLIGMAGLAAFTLVASRLKGIFKK